MLRISKSEGNDSIVSWLPAPYPHTSSNRFKVHNVSEFVSNILPLFFSNQTKFKSFQRQLNLWGFLRIQNGPEKGAYYHKYFLQDSPDLCRLLTRQKYASTTKTLFTSSTRTTYNVDSNGNNTNNKTNTTATTMDTTSISNKEKKKLTNTRSQQRQRKMPFVLTTTSSGGDVVVVRNPQQQVPHRKVSIELSQESSINSVNDHQHNNDQHHLLEKFDDNCFDTLDLEEFEGFTFYHLEQEQCYRRRSKEEEELHNNSSNRNDRLFFTPAMETHQIQQDTISLLKELDQQDNDNDDYGLPKMVFNITSLF